MATIKAFRALRFQQGKTGGFSDVITPPYDVIDAPTRMKLWERSPYNMTRLILPEERDGLTRYEAAANDLEAWIANGVIAQDPKAGFYLLRQTFTGLDGVRHTRRAFFATAKIPEPGEENIILAHERTFDVKVKDRLDLTAATQANLGAVFVLYEDPGQILAPFLAQTDACPPDMVFTTSDNVDQELWRVDDTPEIPAFFADTTLYIADGHHRFRTAVLHRDAMRSATGLTDGRQPWDHVLMGIVEINEPGLVVWPTHRLLDPPAGFNINAFARQLDPWFTCAACPVDEVIAIMNDTPGSAISLAVHGQGACIFTLRENQREALLGSDTHPVWRALDVAVLHKGIIEKHLGLPQGHEFIYDPNHIATLSRVASGDKGMAFLLKAIPPAQVKQCAEARVFMPEKATYFFPKLPSGAAIHRLC